MSIERLFALIPAILLLCLATLVVYIGIMLLVEKIQTERYIKNFYKEGIIIPKGIDLPPDSEGYTIHHNVVYPDDGAREFGEKVSEKVSKGE